MTSTDITAETGPTAANCPRVMVGAGTEIHLRSHCYAGLILCGSRRRTSWITEVPMATEVTCAKCAVILARLPAE